MNIEALSDVKKRIMKATYLALKNADTKKLKKLYVADIEETASGEKPTVSIESCGIADVVFIGKIDCMHKDYYDNL